ncbi:hypothetical protein QUB63_11420 [Microcoleus sp. ARI1-B5]|uniref:hypothetical protein n=1 Tax=Microcoleus sp. ARI1-A4 TaxID=2818559 RepID=UPI002FD2ACE4
MFVFIAEGRSSATDYITDVTDVTNVRKTCRPAQPKERRSPGRRCNRPTVFVQCENVLNVLAVAVVGRPPAGDISR